MGRLEDERQALIGELDNQLTHQQTLKGKAKAVFEQRLNLEREVAQNESLLSFIEQFLSEAQAIEALANRSQFKLLRIENLEKMLEASRQQIEKATEEINETQKIMLKMDVSSEKISSESLDKRVSLALLEFKKANAIGDMKTFEKQLQEAEESLNNAILKAQQSGERIAVIKSNAEIQDEIGLTNGHLAALSEVSEDIERQYESYSKLYLELKEKAQLVAENREKTLQEVQTRMLSWRTVMENLLERVNVEYQKIMSQTLATGEVKLSAAQDIETAGLEIYVGFKGSKPVALDAYTQSGGERTTATMGFLLALQQHVRSPFRAVDEYDIHMDPKNREMIAKVLVSMIKDATAQYVVITPSQITFAQKDANVITVQNLEGKSIVREVV
jgi:chromosome segregation protein